MEKKEMSFDKWLELCSAIGFAQWTLRGIAAQSSDSQVKQAAREAVHKLEIALKETK
jgi:hypothetical protein